MEMESGLVEPRRESGLVPHVNNRVIRKKKMRKRSPSSSMITSTSSISTTTTTTTTTRRSTRVVAMKRKTIPVCVALQELYSCCKRVFKGHGFVPPPNDVQALCNILDRMKPEDLGLSRELQFFKTESCGKEIPRVKCTTIYKCRNFSMALFFLPAGAVIPLHNHPEMTVFSKLLLGTMHIKAYDWVNPVDKETNGQSSPLRLAKLKANDVFTAPCKTSVLYPTTGGNIHAFTAITPCAVLDVLGPPYSKEDGRDCTYYKDSVCTASGVTVVGLKDEDHSYGWLEEIDEPEQSKMDGIQYLGPRIIETAN